jgi:hypothetical protein
MAGALCAVASAPLTLAATNGVPSGAMWDSTGDPAVIGLALIVAGAAAFGVVKVHDEFVADRRRAEKERLEPVQQACRSAMTPIARELAGVPLNELGIHLWQVDGDRLKRVIKYTMDLERSDTPVTWTRGKGVIGLVWETGVALATDLSELYRLAEALDDAEFEAQLSATARYGLTRQELLRAQRYRCVLAIPLSSSDDKPSKETIGVVSVDCMRAGHRDGLDRLRTDPVFSNVVGTCQSYLRGITSADH